MSEALDDMGQTSPVPYSYHPLEEEGSIRLLRMTTPEGQIDNEIISHECELISTKLNSDLQYYAISYVWGDLRQRRSFSLVNGQYLEISISLYTAIHTIYHETGRRDILFWADQICIDQKNLKERSEQVRLMRKIFEGSHRTLVWLGEPDSATRTANTFMRMLSHSRLRIRKAKNMYDCRDLKELQKHLDIWDFTKDEIDNGCAAMVKLSERPWFVRLWTFQEFVVSKRLYFYCGTTWWSRHEILIAFYVTRLLRDARPTGMYHAGCLWKYRQTFETSKPSKRQLWKLLTDVIDSEYQCSELHDRIYAVMDLHTELHDIPVDYTMPIQELLYLTAKSIISYSGNLTSLCRRITNIDFDLPSWVPDWRRTTFQWSINDRKVEFHAAQDYPYQFEESSKGVLLVRGKAVARIEHVVNHPFLDHTSGHENELLDNLVGSNSVVPEVCLHLTPILRARGLPPDRIKTRAIWLMAMTFSGGRLEQAEDLNGITEVDGDEIVRLANLIKSQTISDQKALTKCKGRRIAILDSLTSPLALVPDCATEGDLVCILNGCSTPLVLRKDEDEYLNQSECYVHGIMYGQALDWGKEEGDEFRIK